MLLNSKLGARMFQFFLYIFAVTFPLFGENITADPYRWLENHSPQTEAWLAQQKKTTDAYFFLHKNQELEERLKAIYSHESISNPTMRGDSLFYLHRQPDAQQPCLFRKREGQIPEIVVDPSQYSGDEITSIKDYLISPDNLKISFSLSKAGSDEEEWILMNLDGSIPFKDTLKGLKFTRPAWDATSDGLYYTRCGSGSIYYRALKSDTEEDRLIYEMPEQILDLQTTEDGCYLNVMFLRESQPQPGWICLNLNTNSPPHLLFDAGKNQYRYIDSWQGRFYFIADENTPKGIIISIDPLNPKEAPQVHVPEQANRYIEQACFAGNGNIAVSYLENALSRLMIYDTCGQLIQEVNLPSKGSAGCIWRGLKLQSNRDESGFLYCYTDFFRPLMYFKCTQNGASTPLMPISYPWDSENYEMRQFFYPSKDGTSIPLFLCYKKGTELSLPRPTLLYGYGGFGISITPSFEANKLLWMENGGLYAVANLRGGGEYGEPWHAAGMREKKQTVFDDFIAAAEWLIAQGYATPKTLGINGRSNGGLLVAACLLQRPELFGAVISNVAVLDMLRFHRFTVGANWINEYGNPEDENDASFLTAYSPCHNVKEADYPPVLITTADHDDRVVPLHSYKFAAALQNKQKGISPILLKVYENAGHGPGRNLDQVVQEEADYFNFMWSCLSEEDLGSLLKQGWHGDPKYETEESFPALSK